MIRRMLLKVVQRRAPDVVIGGQDDPYLLRWWLLPRNPVFNVYLHCFKRSDDDRALHDHPWLFNLSWLLRGQYREWAEGTYKEYGRQWDNTEEWKVNTTPPTVGRLRREGTVKFRLGRAPHRIELLPITGRKSLGRAPLRECWTLFITGPRIREWGFYCPKGWRHWKEFTAPHDAGQVGRGCE